MILRPTIVIRPIIKVVNKKNRKENLFSHPFIRKKGKYSKTGFKKKRQEKGLSKKGDRDMSDDSEGVCSQLFI